MAGQYSIEYSRQSNQKSFMQSIRDARPSSRRLSSMYSSLLLILRTWMMRRMKQIRQIRMPMPERTRCRIWEPSGFWGARRREKPARERIFGDIQKMQPFHMGFSLAFIRRSLQLFRNRPSTLMSTVRKTSTTRNPNSPAQLIANLSVSPQPAKNQFPETPKSPPTKPLTRLNKSNLQAQISLNSTVKQWVLCVQQPRQRKVQMNIKRGIQISKVAVKVEIMARLRQMQKKYLMKVVMKAKDGGYVEVDWRRRPFERILIEDLLQRKMLWALLYREILCFKVRLLRLWIGSTDPFPSPPSTLTTRSSGRASPNSCSKSIRYEDEDEDEDELLLNSLVSNLRPHLSSLVVSEWAASSREIERARVRKRGGQRVFGGLSIGFFSNFYFYIRVEIKFELYRAKYIIFAYPHHPVSRISINSSPTLNPQSQKTKKYKQQHNNQPYPHIYIILNSNTKKEMRLLDYFFEGRTKQRYNGFTEDEAKAMAWICKQKAEGKFWGATTGLFVALTWGHYHDRILNYFRVSFNPRLTQLGIIMGSILFFDYLFTGRRRGANELYANYLRLNNNLFLANIGSLVDHFDIFTRKFSEEEIEAFNFRKNLVRTNHRDIADKKWIYNPNVYTPEEFQKRIRMATQAPWNEIKRYSSKYGGEVISGPVNIGRIIDQTGDRLCIKHNFVFGWSPLH